MTLIQFQMVQQENISLNESIIEDSEMGNNDRELIQEFLAYTKEVQAMLDEMENNNKEMHQLVHELVNDKKTAANQKTLSDEIGALISENQGNQNQIKEKLTLMTEDIADSKKTHKDEPETRVK